MVLNTTKVAMGEIVSKYESLLPVPNTTNDHLIEERYPIADLFICDVHDAVLKDLADMMEHPFYALSKKPETTVREYGHNGDWIRVTPSVKGLATIYDKDILIYAVSQIMAKLNRNEPVSKRVKINTHDLLQFTNRGTSGRDYMAIADALERLGGTRISTNIRKGDEDHFTTFGLIDSGTVARKHGLDGRLLWMQIDLADWIFEAIKESAVLTMHRDYFRLRKPLERRLYELARKHCGQQSQWKAGIAILHKKSGSKSPEKKFRFLVKEAVKNDHLPDYMVEFIEDKDQVLFINRNTMPKCKKAPPALSSSGKDILSRLSPDVNDQARQRVPGWDIYHVRNVFAEWWVKIGKPDVQKPDGMFLKFCKSFFDNNGPPS
tara:strand:- start:73393 stop:74523 length:1131 start_codon:yes stop_codon:yes gene_type:complete